jgi:hypothetical protein
MDSSPSSAPLISASAASFDSVPLTGVYDLTLAQSSPASVNLAQLPGIDKRIAGFAFCEIVSPVVVSLVAPPGAHVSATVGWTPTNIPSSDFPKTSAHLMMLGGVTVHASPSLSPQSAELRDVPGVSRVLTGFSTTVVVGNPPQLWMKAVGTTSSGSAASGSVSVVVSFSARLSGLDWCTPW